MAKNDPEGHAQLAALVVHGIAHDYKRVLRSLVRVNKQVPDDEWKKIRARGVELSQEDILKALLKIESNLDVAANNAVSKKLKLKDLLSSVENDTAAIMAEVIDELQKVRRQKDAVPNAADLRAQLTRAKEQIDDLLNTAKALINSSDAPRKFTVDTKNISIRSEVVNKIYRDLDDFFLEERFKPEQNVRISGNYVGEIDRTMFAVVVSNLIKNSIVHSTRRESTEILIQISSEQPKRRASKPTVDSMRSQARIQDRAFDKNLILDFSDNGIGLPRQKVRRDAVFKLFEQGIDQPHKQKRGSGIGLAFARFAAKQMGGDLQALEHSTGAKFRFWVPVDGGRFEDSAS